MKRILIILNFVLYALNAYPQLLVGPKLGATFSKQKKSEYEIWKTGVQYGGSLYYQLMPQISFSGELMISQKGYREEFDGDNAFDQLTATYIEIPGMARYNVSLGQYVAFAGAGVYAAFWQSGTYTSKLGANEPLVVEKYDFVNSPIDNGYQDNRSDFGLLGGIGLRNDSVGSGLLILEGRYQQGLVITNPVDTTPPGYVERKNQNIIVSLTYLLYL